MERGTKILSLWWHRRAGKDDIALHRTACAAFERVGTYWHMLPQSSQARKAIWEGVNSNTGKRRIDEAFPMDIRADTRQNDMFIRFINGSTWQVVGSDNYKSLVGSPPIGLVGSEWAKADPGAWGYLAPILLENGGWFIAITTPEGKNHAYAMHGSCERDPSSFSQTLTVADTDVFTEEQLHAERGRLIDIYGQSLGEALYQQEYFCSAEAAIVGSVYGAEISAIKTSGRLAKVTPANAPVYTAWDIGRTDATAIWWYQIVGNEVRILDCHQSSLKDLAYYSEQIKGRRILSELAAWAYSHEPIRWGDEIEGLEHRREYAYGAHYLPFDAMQKMLAGSGYSTEEILQKSIGNIEIVHETRTGLNDGARNAVMAMLGRAWVDHRAADGLEILSNYRYRYDEHNRIMSKEPLHNWASHVADAARVMALRCRVSEVRPAAPAPERNRYSGAMGWAR